MAIPAKFRDKLSAGAIITRGIDNCLFVFANTEWEKLAQKLIALPLGAGRCPCVRAVDAVGRVGCRNRFAGPHPDPGFVAQDTQD
jgi:hypothetical protein